MKNLNIRQKTVISGILSYSVLYLLAGASYGGLFSFWPKGVQISIFIAWIPVLLLTICFAIIKKPFSLRHSVILFISIPLLFHGMLILFFEFFIQ